MSTKEKFLYKFFMKGKDIAIKDIVAYPASGLEADKVYIITITE